MHNTTRRPLSDLAIVLYVTIGSGLAFFGAFGIGWASRHEVSLVNFAAGRQMYTDTDAVRLFAEVVMFAGLALVAYPIVRAVRGNR